MSSPRAVTRALRLSLLAAALALLPVFLAYDAATPVDAQPTHALEFRTSALTVPVGARICYEVWTTTATTYVSKFVLDANTNTTYLSAPVQVGPASRQDQKVGFVLCVKGVRVTQQGIEITHVIDTDDTNYDEVNKTLRLDVVAAETTPTVRFLGPRWFVEGDTAGGEDFKTFDDYDYTKVTVKLDIAPAPTSNGYVTWYIHHPQTANSGSAGYAVDYVASGLTARKVPYTAGSNDMEFEFLVVADNEQESDETVRIYMKPMYFDPSNPAGIVENTAVCIGSCTSPTEAQQSMVFTIIDDDPVAGPLPCALSILNRDRCSSRQLLSATESSLGRIRIPEDLRHQEQPNRPPTVSAPLSDVTMEAQVNQDLPLDGVFSDADLDPLRVHAESSDTDIVRVGMARDYSALTIGGVQAGTADITVTANDGRGGTVENVFTVTVQAAPPPPVQQDTPTPTPTPEPTPTPTPEPEQDVVARYDANGDGAIDASEYRQAAKDYAAGKIDYTEMLAVIHAMFGG